MTVPIYRDGTIGRAKNDLEQTAPSLDAFLSPKFGGRALICVNKAVVTQASAAIPVVPLYLSLLIKVMNEKGLEEGPIEQMRRLFADVLATSADPQTDAAVCVPLRMSGMTPCSRAWGAWVVAPRTAPTLLLRPDLFVVSPPSPP